MRRQVGHSILTSIHRWRQAEWKKWLQGVTILADGLPTSTGIMQMTHSTEPSPVSSSPVQLSPSWEGKEAASTASGHGIRVRKGKEV